MTETACGKGSIPIGNLLNKLITATIKNGEKGRTCSIGITELSIGTTKLHVRGLRERPSKK